MHSRDRSAKRACSVYQVRCGKSAARMQEYSCILAACAKNARILLHSCNTLALLQHSCSRQSSPHGMVKPLPPKKMTK